MRSGRRNRTPFIIRTNSAYFDAEIGRTDFGRTYQKKGEERLIYFCHKRKRRVGKGKGRRYCSRIKCSWLERKGGKNGRKIFESQSQGDISFDGQDPQSRENSHCVKAGKSVSRLNQREPEPGKDISPAYHRTR